MATFKRGPKSTRVNTEAEFLERVTKEGKEKKRINLGDGLFLCIGKYEDKSFHFRMTIDGIDTSEKIGTYPKTSLDEARRTADEHKAQIKKVKSAEKATALKAKLKKQSISSKKIETPCFTRLSDAGRLYTNVLNKGMSLEFKAVALLTLLLPTLHGELFSATKGAYNSTSHTFTIDNFDSHSNSITFHLPENLAKLVSNLKYSTSNYQDTQPLFPELFNMTPKDRDNTLADIYQNEYTQNPITATSLRKFFVFTVEKYGGFNKEFVNQLVTNQDRKIDRLKNTANSPNYVKAYKWSQFFWRQQHAAIHWYADQILREDNAFDREFIISFV